MASGQADTVAAELTRAGYGGLFLAGDHSSGAAIWRAGANRDPLIEIVRDDSRSDLARVLASEVLFASDDGWPPEGWEDVLGRVYARALAATGAGDRPLVLTGNVWGFLYRGDDAGPMGRHLLEAGHAGVRHLVPLLDDPAPILYEGSQDAMLGNSLRYRVKDAAAYYVGRLRGERIPFHEELDERDAEIDRLRARVAA
jgi:hypothetical protein